MGFFTWGVFVHGFETLKNNTILTPKRQTSRHVSLMKCSRWLLEKLNGGNLLFNDFFWVCRELMFRHSFSGSHTHN